MQLERKKKSIFSSFLVIIFLPTLVYVLAVLAYLDILAIEMPLHTIIMCGVLLLFAIFFSVQNEYCAYAKIKKNAHFFEQDLRQFVKANSLKIGDVSKANVEFDNFLQEYLHKLKPLSFAQIASAVFPMLGILGTFISIAISMPDFKANSSSAIEGEINELLGGIASAFYVSIYGIFLTIWWMFFSRLGLAKINEFKEDFKYASRKMFWSKEELERLTLSKTYELHDLNHELLNRLYDNDFFAHLSALHEEKFKSFSKLFTSYEKIALMHTELAQKSLDLSNENTQIISEKANLIKQICEKHLSELKNIKEEINNQQKRKNENLAQEISQLSREANEVLNTICNAK